MDGHHWLVGSPLNAWTEVASRHYGEQKKDSLRHSSRKAPLRGIGVGASGRAAEAGTIWHHLERNGVSFRNFGEGFELAGSMKARTGADRGALLTNVPMPDPLYRNTSREYPGFNMNVPDQFRATQFIRETKSATSRAARTAAVPLHSSAPRSHRCAASDDGYPYRKATSPITTTLGGSSILSGTRWWKEMAVFVTRRRAAGWIIRRASDGGRRWTW